MLLALGTNSQYLSRKFNYRSNKGSGEIAISQSEALSTVLVSCKICKYMVTWRNLATANPAAYLSHLVSPAVFWQDYVMPKCKPLLDQTRPICYPSVPKRRLGKRNATPGLLKAIQAPYCISFSSFLLASRSFVGPLGIQKASECKLNKVCHLYFTTAFA